VISKKVWRQIKEDFQWRCAYCQIPAIYLPQGLEKEHIVPLSRGGGDVPNNICPACPNCNAHKLKKTSAPDPESGEMVRLFNPYRDIWTDHFEWDKSGTKILGRTKLGRATVAALKMNLPDVISWRKIFVQIGGYPPKLD
jgi:5-methylcytosine-specific restriction endonuclease McrA